MGTSPKLDMKRDGLMLALTYTFDRPVRLEDVAKCGSAPAKDGKL